MKSFTDGKRVSQLQHFSGTDEPVTLAGVSKNWFHQQGGIRMQRSSPFQIVQGFTLGLLGLTAIVWVVGASGETAERGARLDSRTIPHPDWVQVSGQIERTARVKHDNGTEYVQAIVRPSEGGRVAVDFGPVEATDAVRLEHDDFVHVRGNVRSQDGDLMVIAREIHSEGKVIPIHRNEEMNVPQKDREGRPAGQVATGDSVMPSPAAPIPQR
jgi:hypothetical protein